MSFQGDISSLSLGDVFQNISANAKTGTLKIQTDGAERRILFQDGKAVSCGGDEGLPIGNWLVEKGIIAREELEEALRRYRRAKKKSLGEILHDMSVLRVEDYHSYLAILVGEAIDEILSLREGTFGFCDVLEETPLHREAVQAGLSFPAQNLLMEAARRADDWENIRRHIPSENEIYIIPPAGRERFLAETEDEVTREAARLMDGSRSLKKVIAKLPYSRFDSCRAVAGLIAEKKARPLDGSVLPQVAKEAEDPAEVVACLKTILEREPNNRRILQELAELHTVLGQRDESATCWKLLAVSHLEEGDFAKAEKTLRESLQLNPKDIGSWQRLLGVVRRAGDRPRLEALGTEMAARYRALGLMEVLRDHLSEMVKVFPENLDFRLGLADARFALGDHKTSVADLLALGADRRKRQRWAEAERILTQVLKYDSANTRAKKTLDEIITGRYARRAAARKRAVRWALAGTFIAAVLVYQVYDLRVRGEILEATRSVYAEGLLERGLYDEAAGRFKAIEARHPFSSAVIREAVYLRTKLEEKAATAAARERAAGSGRGGSAVKGRARQGN